jgi:hypothetical protein
MKTTTHARKVLKVQHWVGLLAVLLLVSAEFWMVCSLGHACGQVTTSSAIPVPAIGDMFAAR